MSRRMEANEPMTTKEFLGELNYLWNSESSWQPSAEWWKRKHEKRLDPIQLFTMNWRIDGNDISRWWSAVINYGLDTERREYLKKNPPKYCISEYDGSLIRRL